MTKGLYTKNKEMIMNWRINNRDKYNLYQKRRMKYLYEEKHPYSYTLAVRRLRSLELFSY